MVVKACKCITAKIVKQPCETDEQLQNHVQEHEWGCDDCKLCCTSKYFADLHELEHHGDTLDSIRYIRDDIPESTKRLFAAGHRFELNITP